MPDRLRIVFLDYVLDLDRPGRSGLSDIVWDMATELVDLGHEVHVVAPYEQHRAPDARVAVHKVAVPPTAYRWFGGHLWLCKRMADVAAGLRPDVVHAPEYVSTAVYQMTKRGPWRLLQRTVRGRPQERSQGVALDTRLIVTVPGNIYQKTASKFGNPYSFLFTQTLKWAARVTARSADSVIAISSEMKYWWERTGSAPGRTSFIPLGANPRRFHPVEDSRERLGLPLDRPLFLFVGRYSREKAVLELVRAHAAAAETLRAAEAMTFLVGKGPLQGQVEDLIARLGIEDLIFLKQWVAQDDMKVWYSAADALLLPSYSEGFSRTIPEAFNCGTPVIGTRITGTEDHVLEGHTGYLVEPGDVPGLAATLARVAVDPGSLRGLREQVRAYGLERLTWPKIVTEVVQRCYLHAPHAGRLDSAQFSSRQATGG